MDQNVTAAIVMSLLVVFITTREILKFSLKKEQIRADAMVRAEEVKAKNQLEIEKLFQQDNYGKSISKGNLDDTNNEQKISIAVEAV